MNQPVARWAVCRPSCLSFDRVPRLRPVSQPYVSSFPNMQALNSPDQLRGQLEKNNLPSGTIRTLSLLSYRVGFGLKASESLSQKFRPDSIYRFWRAVSTSFRLLQTSHHPLRFGTRGTTVCREKPRSTVPLQKGPKLGELHSSFRPPFRDLPHYPRLPNALPARSGKMPDSCTLPCTLVSTEFHSLVRRLLP